MQSLCPCVFVYQMVQLESNKQETSLRGTPKNNILAFRVHNVKEDMLVNNYNRKKSWLELNIFLPSLKINEA